MTTTETTTAREIRDYIKFILSQFILADYTDGEILAIVTTTPPTTTESLTALRAEMAA
tara:strand:- start:270 stop:443 length:174 start_codon:yes stop_codon:yes gene_type:complete